jgi:hypothetical protein
MTKLKIIQLESFYTHFLNQIYENDNQLHNLPFHTQINYLLNTGFSAGQNFVPFLNPQQWEAHYIVLNNTWAQVKWATDNGMLDVKSLSEILLHQINHIEPDVLFISDVPGFDFSLISQFKRRPLIVAWLATVVNHQLPWHEIDVILSGISDVRNTILHLGAKSAEKFMSAAPYHFICNKNQTKSNNIAFAGSFFSGIHNDRARQMDRLSHYITDGWIDVYTANQFELSPGSRIQFFQPVYGNDLVNTYANYSMVLDARGNFDLSKEKVLAETANMRIFEATRAGSLLITENSPNLCEYFEINQEIVTYNDFDELKDKLAYYNRSENGAERESIAHKGRNRTINDHSIESRANWLEKILFKYLDISEISTPSKDKIKNFNHYCTYFDSNYLPRGIAMIRSLHRQDSNAHIYVLCLDDATYEVMTSSDENVSLIHIKELLAADTELKLARENRTLIEWYFTITPCIVNYLIQKNPSIHNLYYIDSDLYFYSPIQLLIDESKTSSVQVIEHRFPPQLQHLLVYGRFNVGWVGFSNSGEGLDLIQDYRKLCIDWCYDKIEDDRYGDQKYLDQWPQKFPNCVISKHPGANVAQWNIPGRTLSVVNGAFYINNDPLIFYHFHGVARMKSGNYVIKGDPLIVGNYFDFLYEPYLKELSEIELEFDFSIKNIAAKDIRFKSW